MSNNQMQVKKASRENQRLKASRQGQWLRSRSLLLQSTARKEKRGHVTDGCSLDTTFSDDIQSSLQLWLASVVSQQTGTC